MSQIDQASFLYGQNATFIAELYSGFVENPASVDESWRRFFAELRDEAPAVIAELRGPDWAPNQTRVIADRAANCRAASAGHRGVAAAATPDPPALPATPHAPPHLALP